MTMDLIFINDYNDSIQRYITEHSITDKNELNMIKKETIYRIYHSIRVANNMVNVAKTKEDFSDKELLSLYIIGLYHDISKIQIHEDHGTAAVAWLKTYRPEYCINDDMLNAIALHSYKYNEIPAHNNKFVVMLREADLVDKVNFHNIARKYKKSKITTNNVEILLKLKACVENYNFTYNEFKDIANTRIKLIDNIVNNLNNNNNDNDIVNNLYNKYINNDDIAVSLYNKKSENNKPNIAFESKSLQEVYDSIKFDEDFVYEKPKRFFNKFYSTSNIYNKWMIILPIIIGLLFIAYKIYAF